MENMEELGIPPEEFRELYKEVAEKKENKKPINSGSDLADQLVTFGKFSFDEEDEKALHEDALSACALTTVS